MEVVTESASETENLGRKIGSYLKEGKIKSRILALIGGLGGGKTTFVKGLAKGLGIKRRVSSPTFILCREYSFGEGRFLFHLDLYRLDSLKAVESIGIKQILAGSKNLVVVEWAEKAAELFPKGTVRVYFKYLGEQKRKVKITGISKVNLIRLRGILRFLDRET